MSLGGSMRVVIVGNGIAGNEVATRLRMHGADCSITCLCAEACPEYDPCSLTYYVAGDIERDVVFRRRMEEYAGLRVDLRLGEEAVSFDPARREVSVKSGATYPYDKLVLAQGGALFVPPIPGVELDGVFACKRLGHADALFRHEGRRAVIIGSGAIGIEAAEALRKRGSQVTVVELRDRPLPTLFDEPAARILEAELRADGIEVLCKERVLRLEGEGTVERVVTDARELPCDTVIIAAGVVPDVSLARAAGLDTGRGIKVDDRMRTSAKDVFACGDCVETFDAVTGGPCAYLLKHNAIEQARVAAASVLGMETRYAGAYPFARVHFFDTHAVSFGHTLDGLAGRERVEVLERRRHGYLQAILEGGRLIGAQAVGEVADRVGALMGAMWRRDDLGELRSNWTEVSAFGSRLTWQQRELGRLLGLGEASAGEWRY